MKNAYITKISKFLPNSPVENDQIEDKLGFIDGQKSRAKSIILRNNKIKKRYYAIDENGNVTHNNAQLTAAAIKGLCDANFSKDQIELLSCGTSTPDQLLPSHAAMVHGELKNGNMEINSASGVCCSGMNALKYGYMAIKVGQVNNAVCTGSEKVSTWTKADFYQEEIEHLKALEENPMIAFDKDFLRWMLSDGSGAMLVENEPKGDTPLKIEWMEGFSYAFEMETCMYAGGEKLENGELKPWSEFAPEDWAKQSVFAIKQDVKLLGENILKKGVDCLKEVYEKHGIGPDDVDYYLPHISSYFFKQGLYDEMKDRGVEMPWEKWFLNLEHVGNVGAASIYLMLEELVASGKLKKGDRILLHVPESARFSYTYAYLTVC
ncbi:3-oxoacyl-[acyl-carrier-protein] synthase-3 [Zobellia uliginosa]|uniref:3-oxoacyl-[acyl-carrier-protein] synthase-3 n=1 Tax=Zobellia uliginosa TaxID=143224 RepID=A0ABY1L104_9FLAO|nr:beta-ketoacyl-ACP synthase III [Zobellia uliginosa]SIT05858.1 3-oxoacyl-[acyl-carrier-protein] synthase-3 [Zobellia uliginosa]